MFPVWLIKNHVVDLNFRPPRRLRKPPRPRERPGAQPALTVVHRGSDAVGEWRNQAEKCGKRMENHGKRWENGLIWTDASSQKHDDLVDRNGFVFTFS